MQVAPWDFAIKQEWICILHRSLQSTIAMPKITLFSNFVTAVGFTRWFCMHGSMKDRCTIDIYSQLYNADCSGNFIYRKTILLHVRPSALEREGACNVIKTINQNEACRKFVPINQANLWQIYVYVHVHFKFSSHFITEAPSTRIRFPSVFILFSVLKGVETMAPLPETI